VILVLDSSGLITLARIGRLDLLRQIAGGVHIPEAVYEVPTPAEGGGHSMTDDRAGYIGTERPVFTRVIAGTLAGTIPVGISIAHLPEPYPDIVIGQGLPALPPHEQFEDRLPAAEKTAEEAVAQAASSSSNLVVPMARR
jgi:hypothetical protein